jgi:2-methylcitrate dehydratase PrpD
MINAISLAGDQASGLRQFHFGENMTKHFHAGKAAESGILAALLAQRGFTGPQEILEGK